MKKSLFMFVATAMAFAGCSNDEYTGTMPNVPQEGQSGAILFAGRPGNTTRAQYDATTNPTAAEKLDYKFDVFGVKNVGNATHNVFAKTANRPADDDATYNVWYVAGSTSTSNQTGWEYVGASDMTVGKWNKGLNGEQTIKYWDYKATSYEFVAYAKTIETPATVTNVTEDGFTLAGNPTQLASFYIADKLNIAKANFNDVVKFTFRAAGTKVRLGIYETIPGYKVTSITFRYEGGESTASATSNGNAYLDGKFIGNANTSLTAKVCFASDGKAVVEYDKDAQDVATTSFDFGTFELGAAMGTSSADPTWASKNYLQVLPNTVNKGPMTLYVDYVLTSEKDNTGETITVTGAKAVVPASYMVWNPNYAYTYLFKITDETNGTTGGTGDPAGLYPIIFDAVVEEVIGSTEEGTVTTTSAYSITTYQNGSVVSGGGVEYNAGTIDVTVEKASAATAATLTALNVYDVTSEAYATEADLALAQTDLAAMTAVATSATEKVSFTAAADSKYAVVVTYTDENGNTKYCYKLIQVKAATTTQP